jgi:hypothetical protein
MENLLAPLGAASHSILRQTAPAELTSPFEIGFYKQVASTRLNGDLLQVPLSFTDVTG